MKRIRSLQRGRGVDGQLVLSSASDKVCRCMSSAVNKTISSEFHNTQPYDIKIVEVGPRDGLQNEPKSLSVDEKVTFIRKLFEAGCSVIEAGAFVSPKWVPQMANSDQVFHQLSQYYDNKGDDRPYLSCLVPNAKGMEQALKVPGVDEVAIFASASEEFSQRNIACSIAESIKRFGPVIEMAKSNGDIPVRGYVSTVVGCPYQGAVAPKQVAGLVQDLLEMGCYEISLGDTIGVGTPTSIHSMLDEVLVVASPSQLAMHCHDTHGQALANILVGLERGITTVDSSVAGLGGCPYAKGASGNVATEAVVSMLHGEGMGLSTGIDLDQLAGVGRYIVKLLSDKNRT